jgi:hypothetical protein
MQYVEKQFMEVDYNMLVQNHVYYNMLKKNHLMGLVVQWLRIWLVNVEVRSSSLHTCNLGYVIYLSNPIM